MVAKVAFFFGMVVVAAINRFRLTPRLGDAIAAAQDVRRQLRRNAVIEIVLGVSSSPSWRSSA
jgi:putative copper export protein